MCLSPYSLSIFFLDSVNDICRKDWPFQMSSTCLPATGIKEAYLARHVAVQQFKFNDPWSSKFPSDSSPHTRLLLDKDDIILSQVSTTFFSEIFISGVQY